MLGLTALLPFLMSSLGGAGGAGAGGAGIGAAMGALAPMKGAGAFGPAKSLIGPESLLEKFTSVTGESGPISNVMGLLGGAQGLMGGGSSGRADRRASKAQTAYMKAQTKLILQDLARKKMWMGFNKKATGL